MSKKVLSLFLVVEALCALNAIVAFRVFEDRYTAGMIAGAGFVGGVGWIYWQARRFVNRSQSMSFWASWLNLFLTCLPMFIIRLLTPSEEQIATIAGMDAQTFHQLAEWLFLALILATVADLARQFKKKN